ncbi:MAG: alpha/beta hydrolase [Candidatus Binatus sp.]|uniref:alpha/beta fold hydrolase n=1 Tax=Candidatus Binatus sp. TaxID=2811406 RepID=UPI0027223981|nr:alpha/beta hydrolase [Candidatus Binatus sp.]MDO8432946.1 alpha/beta hydrolase [Candidatus Binatus sp.]
MTQPESHPPPHSHLLEGSPRLHYLEWNPEARRTIVLLHGNSANAWWWEPVARAISPEFRILALDQRGHGDSEWVRPPSYTPADYAGDIARLLDHASRGDETPMVAGHSMGGLSVLAFAERHPARARAIVAIDVAVTSSRGRDRYLRRLKSLPVVTYPDLETATARFRLMPDEGSIDAGILREIAEKSIARTEDGRWTLKFDRESFFGSDGLAVLEAMKKIQVPTLLVRAEHSRIMTDEAAREAEASNPLAELVTILGAHHHVLLENPAAVAQVLETFAKNVGWA